MEIGDKKGNIWGFGDGSGKPPIKVPNENESRTSRKHHGTV